MKYIKIIHFIILLTLISSVSLSQQGGGSGLEGLKGTLEVLERCATQMRADVEGQNPDQIQLQMGQLRNVLVDFPSVQVQVRETISALNIKVSLKEELFSRVQSQAKLLDDLGRDAGALLPLILQREGLKAQRQALVRERDALYERYDTLHDQNNAHEQEIYSRVRESLEWKTFGTIASRFREELSFCGLHSEMRKGVYKPGNAALDAADKAYKAGNPALISQMKALDAQIKTVVPSTEPFHQLYETFQRQARILDGILITIAPSPAPGLAQALEQGSIARLVDIESSSERVAIMVLDVTTKDILKSQGRVGIEGFRRVVLTLGQIDPKSADVDVEKADALIERFIQSDAAWSFETVRLFMREFFTESLRRPKL